MQNPIRRKIAHCLRLVRKQIREAYPHHAVRDRNSLARGMARDRLNRIYHISW